MNEYDLPRRLAAEALGTACLLATVVGSGIMAETLAGGNVAVALIGNTLATGAILMVLILVFGPISGAHFNPAVTLSFVMQRRIGRGEALAYVGVQVVAGLAGVVLAHIMFDQPTLFASTKARSGIGQWTGEFVATFGLVATIIGCVKFRPSAVPYAVGLFISAGYWFTSSTSFANPAVTIARAMSDTFSGILPGHAPAFIAAQFVGAIAATIVLTWLIVPRAEAAANRAPDETRAS
ncbi:MAG: aquaporin family protein [Rhodospirillaceae bacterium]|jgi:glycerol uptake facilitator-like aquaporin|nr:aquaporin family protein [Rhodospirillaceae bacterium]MBT6119463.1 aquaporin family protein [Rhodospirillaceae bacterium]